jgi:ferritin-like metal-binding protein YciE
MDAMLIAAAQKVEHYEIASMARFAPGLACWATNDVKEFIGPDAAGRKDDR